MTKRQAQVPLGPQGDGASLKKACTAQGATGQGAHCDGGGGHAAGASSAASEMYTLVSRERKTSSPAVWLKMWKEQEYVDIAFECGNKPTLYAHRTVLAMQSKELKAQMSNAFFSEFQPGLDMATVSFENPVLFEALVFILDFIYTGKCMLPRTGELPEQVMDLSATWGLTAIKDQLEAHGFLSLTPKSCAACLVHVYNKGSHDDWETRARRELDLVLRNFETIKEKDLLLLPEPVMAAILASSGLAVTSEKQVLDRLKFWMKHELVPSQDLARDKPGSVEGKRADEVQSMTIEARKTIRGMELLKHIRWPEFQREGLSEMFMSPDPEIAHFITPLVIESLAWANFSTEARRQRIANADVSQHPKHLPMHVMVPRDAPLPMTPLHGYVEGLDVRDKGQKVHAVGGTGGVAVFGHSTNSTTHHYILEWTGAETDHPDDCYVGIMCATSLSLEKSGCFVLCETGKDEPENYSPGQPVQLTVNAANKELELWAIDEDNRPHKCLNTKQCQSIATPWIPCVALFHQGSSFTWRLADPV